MTMFERGDVVHIRPVWLDRGEDPDHDYYVLEDKTDEVFEDGRVDIMYKPDDGRKMGAIQTVSYDMVYKVGHIDLDAYFNESLKETLVLKEDVDPEQELVRRKFKELLFCTDNYDVESGTQNEKTDVFFSNPGCTFDE